MPFLVIGVRRKPIVGLIGQPSLFWVLYSLIVHLFVQCVSCPHHRCPRGGLVSTYYYSGSGLILGREVMTKVKMICVVLAFLVLSGCKR